MSDLLPLVGLLTIGVPIAWLVSEFQDRRWIRITCGTLAIGMSFLVAAGIGRLQHLNANAWCGAASKSLIDTTIEQIESGHTDPLLRQLKVLQVQFRPTYESRTRYDKLVDGFVSRIGREQENDVLASDHLESNEEEEGSEK